MLSSIENFNVVRTETISVQIFLHIQEKNNEIYIYSFTMVFGCCKTTNVVIETANDPKAYSGFVISEERNPCVQDKATSESFDVVNSVETDDVLSEYIRFTSQNQSDDNNLNKSFDAEGYAHTNQSNFNDGTQAESRGGSIDKTASCDSSDDDITTVYEEPLRNKPLSRQISTQGSVVSAMQSMKTSVVSRARSFKDYVFHAKNISNDLLYVLVPNSPQRGFELQQVNYQDYSIVSEKPYVQGASVWYRSNGDHTLQWYIPATVKDYVLTGNQVTGYVLQVECLDDVMTSSEKKIMESLQNADPVNTMLRWDEKIPECPINIKIETQVNFGSACEVQLGHGPELWGVTLEQIQEIRGNKRYKSWMCVNDVVTNVISPMTKGAGVGYALLKNKDDPKRVRTMISYSSQENFDDICTSLAKSKVEGPYWFSALSMNQNESVEGKEINKTKCRRKLELTKYVMKQCRNVLAITTDFIDIFSSLSCIHEIYLAVLFRKSIRFLNFSGGEVANDSGDKVIRSLSAECIDDTERELLHSEIQNAGGFFLIDDSIMWARVKAQIDEIEILDAQERSESRLSRPIGSCSTSNIVAKQNAKIALAMHTWKQSKDSRNPVDELQITKIDSMTAEFTVPSAAKSGEELGFLYNDLFRRVKVPKGEQGKRIQVKFHKQEKEEENDDDNRPLAFCGVNCY